MALMGSFQIGAIDKVSQQVEQDFRNSIKHGRYTALDLIQEFVGEGIENSIEEEVDVFFDALISAISSNDRDSMMDFLHKLADSLMIEGNIHYKQTFDKLDKDGSLNEEEFHYLQGRIRGERDMGILKNIVQAKAKTDKFKGLLDSLAKEINEGLCVTYHDHYSLAKFSLHGISECDVCLVIEGGELKAEIDLRPTDYELSLIDQLNDKIKGYLK